MNTLPHGGTGDGSGTGTELVIVEHGPITDRVKVYHNIARSCAAYAIFYGAMAGQELIRLRMKVGNYKFRPTLESSMPWLSRSTAYLYISYAEKFSDRLREMCPAVGHIELSALPDPRDYEATERTELFSQVREKTGLSSADQLWLALGLMREPKDRGGDTSKFQRKEKPTAEALHDAELEAWTLLVNELTDRAFGVPPYKVTWDRLNTPDLADLNDQLYRVYEHFRETLKARKAAK